MRFFGALVFSQLWLGSLVMPLAAAEPVPRPEISLTEAHDATFPALTPDLAKEFYCLNAFLGEDRAKDGRIVPLWHVQLMNDDGVQLGFRIPRDAKGKITVLPPIPAPQLIPGVTSLTELTLAIAGHPDLPKGVEILQGDGIAVQHRTRTFRLHEPEASGEWSAEPHEVIGPTPDGFVMRVREVKRGESRRRSFSDVPVYWRTARRFYPGFTPDSELMVDIDFGKDWAALDMFRAVGPRGSERPASGRPKLTLPEACQRAMESLGPDDRERYYVLSASSRAMQGTREHPGEWQLRLGAANGDTLQLVLDEGGKVGWLQRHRAFSDSTPKIRSIADAERQIPEMLKSLGMHGDIAREGNKVTLEIQPRTYMVHPELESNVYAEEVVEVRGPGARGYLLTIEEAEVEGELKRLLEEKRVPPWSLEYTGRGYFRRHKIVCRTDDANRVLILDITHGTNSAAIGNALEEFFEHWEPDAPATTPGR